DGRESAAAGRVTRVARAAAGICPVPGIGPVRRRDRAGSAYPVPGRGRGGAVEIWLTLAFGHGFRDVMERRLPGSWERAAQDAGTAFGVELAALQDWSVGPDDLTRLRVPTLSVVHTPIPGPVSRRRTRSCWRRFRDRGAPCG